MKLFKKKNKRSEWMQGLLDCEDTIKVYGEIETLDIIKNERDLDIDYPEHSFSYKYYEGMYDYLDHQRRSSNH